MPEEVIDAVLAQFYDQIAEWDLECKQDLGDYDHQVFYLCTMDDPSVGIFGGILTDDFDSQKELADYWFKNKKKILKEAYPDEDF